ncbi:MAG: putative cobaltochelatase [Thermodesulfobacteriota bacterium]|nr:putative cobaltochelatase [Thermodesulfobacteriota bacterium]
MKHLDVLPFSAIVGQEALKLVLILNAVNPSIGGVLISGEKGTAKSTTVRALSMLLPEIKVVDGCPYSCDPDDQDNLCDLCQKNASELSTAIRRQKAVTLPLNATEDRVAGGIDFNRAVKQGVRMLQPGVLAEAHRGILYVDEVNLLDDHIVDIILDAAASGRNHIEREGISFAHPSQFILVGTMNPEEGDLRPQLLDRFGLCIEVSSEKDPDLRILMIERRETFDQSPAGFLLQFGKEDQKLSDRIHSARKLLPKVRLLKYLRTLITEICIENNVAGHRADLAIEQAAIAHAAWFEHPEATVEDIQAVAGFALLHRKREAAPPPPPPPQSEQDQKQDEPPENSPEENQEEEKDQAEEPPNNPIDSEQSEPNPLEKDDPSKQEQQEKEQTRKKDAMERISDVGETFKVKKIVSSKDQIFRRRSGRRSRTRTSQKQGRYVKSTMKKTSGDIALDATLRAAAPYQIHRSDEKNGLAVCLKPEDIREKVREKRIGNFLLFIVDASGSMGAKGRMAASKGAIMSLLMDAYQKRDKVGMISFRKDEAFVNLLPTSSIELAAKLLKEMPVGGRTPLSAGLIKGYKIIRNYLLREPSARPIVLIITDGKSNVSLGDRKPMDEAFLMASCMGFDERVQYIVIDTEQDSLVHFGLARRLAEKTGAAYFKIDDLKADTLMNIVKEASIQ